MKYMRTSCYSTREMFRQIKFRRKLLSGHPYHFSPKVHLSGRFSCKEMNSQMFMIISSYLEQRKLSDVSYKKSDPFLSETSSRRNFPRVMQQHKDVNISTNMLYLIVRISMHREEALGRGCAYPFYFPSKNSSTSQALILIIPQVLLYFWYYFPRFYNT